jgi:hypothetical protein
VWVGEGLSILARCPPASSFSERVLAGLSARASCRRRSSDGVDVTLIDKNDAFVFGYSKLDVMFGRATPEEVRLAYRDIAKPGVRLPAPSKSRPARSLPRRPTSAPAAAPAGSVADRSGSGMRRVGVEPTRPYGQGLLRASRLPFRHRRTQRIQCMRARARVAGASRARRSGGVRRGVAVELGGGA